MSNCKCNCGCESEEGIPIPECQAKIWCEKNVKWLLDDLCNEWFIKQGDLEEKRSIIIRITEDRIHCYNDSHGIKPR